MIEQHQASAPAMMDRADEATPLERIVDHHQASRKAVMGKMAIDRDVRKVAARIVQSFREAGFGCELLSPLPLH
jgi:carbon monoxide dehydrogenase subunit G